MQNLIEVQNLGDAKHWKVPILGRGAMLKDAIFFDFAPFDIKIQVVKVYQHRVWRIFLVCVFEAIEEFEARIEGLQGRQS